LSYLCPNFKEKNAAMTEVTTHDKTFRLMIPEADIRTRVKAMGIEISADYLGKKPLLIAILNGAFIFAADLIREIDIDCEISFVKLASYKGTGSTGTVQTVLGLDTPLAGRHIIIVEDIIDTGTTLNNFLQALEQENPATITLACCFHKPEALKHPLSIDYCCFEIPNKFIVGYGLDYDGLGRNYASVYQLAE
jgi:hypoxanthine phosphoribosyltransferase